MLEHTKISQESNDANSASSLSTPFLEVRDVRKDFGGIQALKNASLVVMPGEVHGLVGANGAGKSTLIRCLAGLVAPDTGSLFIDGAPVEIHSPQDATRLGLSFIHQELNIIPRFSVLQNILLGQTKPNRLGLINWKEARKQVQDVVKRLDITFSLDAPMNTLSVADQWLVSIGRSLVHKARFIAMDEPTASLSAKESERLFRIIRELAADGISILYVSHHLDEILDLCDHVTIMRDGQYSGIMEKATMNRHDLITAIAGREVEVLTSVDVDIHPDQEPLLEVKALQREPVVHDVSFSLQPGEVIGLVGLVGAGRTEVARMIFGADHPDAGTFVLDGKPYKPKNTYDAIKHGVGLVPEERRSQGVILSRSVSFNINLTALQNIRVASWLPLTNLRRGATKAAKLVDSLHIKTRSVNTPVSQLSGGNQQKVVIGKWLDNAIRLLILDEPTRGVDIGARTEIHHLIRKLAADGAGVLVISSDFDEIPGLCDRVLVMAEGYITGELVGSKITREAILQLSYAHKSGTEE
ncbi:MAG TPA: sugar ABC transporter ATP-binding protein [Ktedonobacteraceae bacterium]|jgi:ABC-type sugar transport system ATPase subunit